MVDRNFLLGRLPTYEGKRVLVKKNQDTTDIINEMLTAHRLHHLDYDKISNYFWKGNLYKTGKYIFDFLKHNVKYSIEPDHRQSVKSPSGILATGYYKNGFNDCKHYSQFISGILDSLKRKGKKIDWFYRFANYRLFTNQPQHVFVVATDGVNEIWIDPVLNTYNQKKNYISKIDKKMSLYNISGIDDNSYTIDGIGRRKKRDPSKPRKGIFNKIKNVVSKVSLAPSRAAFLGIIKLNPFKIANKLFESLQNPQRRIKLLKKWQNLGGNPKTFERLIVSQYARWKKRKKISGIDSVAICGDHDELGYIGFLHHLIRRDIARRIKAKKRRRQFTPAQIQMIRKRWTTLQPQQKKLFTRYAVESVSGIGAVQLVAILAVAAPIIAALAEFLPKGMKQKAQQAQTQVPEVIQQQVADAANNNQLPAPSNLQTARVKVEDDISDQQTVKRTIKEVNDDEDIKPGGFKLDNKTLLLIAGAGAVIVATRK